MYDGVISCWLMHCSIASIILNPCKFGMIFLQQSFTHFPSVTSFSVSISATSFLINSFTSPFALYSAISSALILSEPGIFLSSERCLSFSSPISVSHLFRFLFSVFFQFMSFFVVLKYVPILCNYYDWNYCHDFGTYLEGNLPALAHCYILHIF